MSNESLLELAVKTGKERTLLAFSSLSAECYREWKNLYRFDDERMIPATADIKARFDELEEQVEQLRQAWKELQYSKQGGCDEG